MRVHDADDASRAGSARGFYPNEHRPAHVHVKGAGGEAVFVLNCPKGPLVLRQSYGFPLREVNHIAEALSIVLKKLCAEWKSIHGHY